MSAETALALATGQTITPPVAPVEGVAAPTDDKPLESTRFKHLAQKEAELQKQREEFKKERDAIEAEKLQFKPLAEQFKKFQELKKTNPIEAIKMLEFSDEDFVNFLATREDTSTPEEKARKAAQAEIDNFKKEQLTKEQEATKAHNDKIISEFKQSINKTITSDKEKFELSNAVGTSAEELAYDFVYECVQLGMEAPSAEEAAEYVEKYYEDYFKEIMKSKKLTPQEAVAQAKEAAAAPDAPLKAEVSPKTQAPKTLTNKATATVASTITRKETREEKRERLMKQLAAGG